MGFAEPNLAVCVKQEEKEDEVVDIFSLASDAGILHMLGDRYFGGRYCL